MTLSETDRKKIHELLQASTEAKNMMSMREMDAVLSGDFLAALNAAKGRNTSVRLHTAHLIVYDIMFEAPFPTPMEHLSVSHPKMLNEADVMTIAAEFGMGDRSTWSMHMTIGAYHIFREIVTKPRSQ